MNIVALESADWPNAEVKKAIQAAVERASDDASKVLPHNTANMNIIVQPNKHGCIPETGDSGRTFNSEFIKIDFDPTIPYGLDALLISLRATAFHEYNHAIRYAVTQFDDTFLNHAITEGLATVFERDFADSRPPLWGNYENRETMQAWLKEVQATNLTADTFNKYTYMHPDGRRWIAYKLGTWIVDEALKNSKKTVQELTVLPYDDILKLAFGVYEK